MDLFSNCIPATTRGKEKDKKQPEKTERRYVPRALVLPTARGVERKRGSEKHIDKWKMGVGATHTEKWYPTRTIYVT